MKKFLLATLALSTAAFADTDYSRCSMMSGYQIDHENKVVPGPGATIKSQRTEGNKETIVFEQSIGTRKYQTEASFERDAQGRVVRVISGGDRPSAQTIQRYRENMVNSSVMSAGFSSGMNEDGRTNFMSQEPTFFLRKRSAQTGENAPAPAQTSTQGGFVGGFGDYEMVPLSRLTQEQAREVGIENVEELRRMRDQWRRDRRTSQKLRQGYETVVSRSSLVIPLGTDTEFEIVDGVCLPKATSQRYFNSQANQVYSVQTSSRANCDKVQSVYRRHERKIKECNDESMAIQQDYMREMFPAPTTREGGSESGSATGGTHGGMGGMVGGIAGGYVAGYGGGMYGGYGMGMGMGYMGGMYGMGMYMGGDMNSVSMQNMMCEWTYNRDRQIQRNREQMRGTTTSGSTTEAQ